MVSDLLVILEEHGDPQPVRRSKSVNQYRREVNNFNYTTYL